jgi:tripartite-type tricarboxylate transporter receptor subunit TctC
MRSAWRVLCAAGLALSMIGAGVAQDWPQKPVRIIVPFGAGSADTAARLLAEGLRARTGKVVVVDNRPGAGQNVGAGVLARATPDGATIMVTAPGPLVINEFLYPKLEFDPHAFVPVLLLTTDPLVFVVHSKAPFRTLQDFLDQAKRHPGKYTYASAGAGAASHMMTAILFSMAGVDVTHVPYKGGAEAAHALLAGHVDFLASSPVSAVPQIQGGTFRPLAVTAKGGAAILPGVPPVAVAGVPGYDYATWLAVVGPPGLRADLAARIAATIEAVFQSPDLRGRLSTFGSQYEGGGPARLADWIRTERVKWKSSVEASGAKAR